MPRPARVDEAASSHESFSIALVGRLKHGALIEAMNRRGWNQTDLARALDTTVQTMGRFINMQEVPSKRWRTPKREKTLLDLTGQLAEDLWPEWSRDKTWLLAEKRIGLITDVPVQSLLDGRTFGLLNEPSSPEDDAMRHELRALVLAKIRTLTPREEKVIKMRFGVGDGIEHTSEEVAQNFGVTRERIRQIEAKAIRKLQTPSRAKVLAPYAQPRQHRVDADEDEKMRARWRWLQEWELGDAQRTTA